MPDNNLRFFILTCRDERTDFRLPLVEVLRPRYETFYIWLKRTPVITYPDGRRETVSFLGLMQFFHEILKDKINVFFNSTNTSFPFVTALLKFIAPPSVWCLDLHDDLRYHYTGLQLLHANIGINVMRLTSDVLLHAAPTLQELFPASRHLGNASHIRPMRHDDCDPADVLILASFDPRFDHVLMEATARLCPGLRFRLYGQLHGNAALHALIEKLVADNSNITYHGAYTSDDLPLILRRHAVTFAPYRTPHALTRYIDPLRYYHCLNAGLRVVTTGIPQALALRDLVTIIDSPDAAAQALLHPSTVPSTRLITWEQRADTLISILDGLPKKCRLEKALSGNVTTNCA